MNKLRDPLMHVEMNNITGSKLNWLRAAVLGANDGIVSVASVIVGVAGATQDTKVILTAALVAGALSMAAGEYVSVSTQRDTERALLEKERIELKQFQIKNLKNLLVFMKRKDCLDLPLKSSDAN